MKLRKRAHRFGAAAAGEKSFAEAVAILALQAAVLLEPFDAVRIEHFAPEIGVVAGGITVVVEGVREIGGAITRRDEREIDAGFFERLGFEGERIGRDLVGRELMPGLIERRGGDVGRSS